MNTKCSNCNGRGIIECSKCDGNGSYEVDSIGTSLTAFFTKKHVEPVMRKCDNCVGQGTYKCPDCYGRGYN